MLVYSRRRLTVTVLSAAGRFRWYGFFPALGAVFTVRLPSVEVTIPVLAGSLKQASCALIRWAGTICRHSSTVKRCLAYCAFSENCPRPCRALSASTYWLSTNWRSLSTRSGSFCGCHCTADLSMWFTDSQLLFVHAPQLAAMLSRSMCSRLQT